MSASDQSRSMPSNIVVSKIPRWYKTAMMTITSLLAVLPSICVMIDLTLAVSVFSVLLVTSFGSLWLLAHGCGMPWVVKLAAHIYGCAAVEMMHYDGTSVFTLAHVRPDHTGWAHVHWLTGIGSVKLLPCGIVDANSESSYLYIWRYLDKELHIAHALSWDIPNWQKWQSLSHIEKSLRRQDQHANLT